MSPAALEPGSLMLAEAARRSRSAVILGHGGGSDCFLAALIAEYLTTLGVDRVMLGGIACQWWPEPGRSGELLRVVGPDLYDPTELENVDVIHDYAVVVGPDSRLPDGRAPHEAALAAYTGRPTFILSHRGGAKGSAAGLAEVIRHADADLVATVDVGSDTLSTGREVRPVQTAFADHLTLAAVASQPIDRFFCLAGYGADAEMEIEELDRNFSAVLRVVGSAARWSRAPRRSATSRRCTAPRETRSATSSPRPAAASSDSTGSSRSRRGDRSPISGRRRSRSG